MQRKEETAISLIKNLIIISVLVEGSICDIKFRKIRLFPSVLAGVLLLALAFLCPISEPVGGIADTLRNLLSGAAPGLMLYLLSRLTAGKIGEGDACMLTVIGIGAGLAKALLIVCTGFGLAAVPAGFLFLRKKTGKDTCLPFIPFLLAGYLLNAPV